MCYSNIRNKELLLAADILGSISQFLITIDIKIIKKN